MTSDDGDTHIRFLLHLTSGTSEGALKAGANREGGMFGSLFRDDEKSFYLMSLKVLGWVFAIFLSFFDVFFFLRSQLLIVTIR